MRFIYRHYVFRGSLYGVRFGILGNRFPNSDRTVKGAVDPPRRADSQLSRRPANRVSVARLCHYSVEGGNTLMVSIHVSIR